ncbi:hypothetical protein [Ferruginibacter sp. HRS2-29]|uniref:hypothetical protein n=1 Tax=Ferruginibacter sp. HRS2-29 TaxID=2487334 RepID=UPI0020CDCC8B|nr:hypothetical protein [Ferruginibacter sp. HRS2-29]MCP9749774.1 hypothetical protein [Ferruginibacter sp. HRS2-29]
MFVAKMDMAQKVDLKQEQHQGCLHQFLIMGRQQELVGEVHITHLKINKYFMLRYVICILAFQIAGLWAIGQKLVSIGKYYVSYDEENYREDFKIVKQKFAYDQHNRLYLNDSLLLIVPKDSVFEIEVYADRYVFLSMYPFQKQYSPLPVERQQKERVVVYDLNHYGKHWDFHFLWHTSQALRWFDPKRSKIKLVRENIITASIH